MSDVIGDLSSVSFTLNTSYDVYNEDLGLVKHSNNHIVKMQGPDKLQITSNGDKGHRGFWYNGEKLFYYSYDKNNYASIDTKKSLMEMIDTANKEYGIEFPGADIFYSSFTDDLIKEFDNIVYLGKVNLAGEDCFHIIAANDVMSFQIWLADDVFTTPKKIVTVDLAKQYNTQYEATFSNWNVNQTFPNAIFNFTPVPQAKKITIKKLNSKK